MPYIKNGDKKSNSKNRLDVAALGGWCYNLISGKYGRSTGAHVTSPVMLSHLTAKSDTSISDLNTVFKWIKNLSFEGKVAEGIAMIPSCPLIFNYAGIRYILYYFFPTHYCTVFPHYVVLVNPANGNAALMETMVFSSLYVHLAKCYAISGLSSQDTYVQPDENKLSAFVDYYNLPESRLLINQYNAYVLKEAKKQQSSAQPFIKAFMIDVMSGKPAIELMNKNE